MEKLEAAIEAILFSAGDSVETGRIAKAIGQDKTTTEKIIRNMMLKYNARDRGIKILELDGAFQLCTKQEYYEYLVEIALQPKKAVLTDVMLETLSIIAYKQPVTKQEIEKIFVENQRFHNMMVSVLSFGFKYGIPVDADLVFDVRCFPNPFYIDELKRKTGNDKEVQDYVMSFPTAVSFMEKLNDMLDFMIPLYIEEGKVSLTVAIGCTGGKHRSVTMTNKLAEHLKQTGHEVNVSCRDIGRE